MRALTLVLLVGCTTGSSGTDDTDLPALDAAAVGEVMATYAEIARAAYEDARGGAESIEAATAAFVAAPDATTLAAARTVWLEAREPYLRTEVFRFYGGPIDAVSPPGPEGRINSWPLDEVYLDYVADPLNPGVPRIGGIVNDPEGYPDITPEALLTWNQPQSQGETAVAAGYHAIEFLLWGQDLSVDGPGDRPASDYVEGVGPGETVRRGQLLAAASALLVTDLQSVADAWQPGADWRTSLLALPPAEALGKVLTGLGSLSGAELAGERMQVAYDSQSQEDEHSCFSDNTHRDIVGDAEGMRDLYLGTYARMGGTVVSGPSLYDLLSSTDPALADDLQAALEDSVAKAALLGTFDQEIVTPDGRERVAAVIAALGVQTGLIVEMATAFGVSLNLED